MLIQPGLVSVIIPTYNQSRLLREAIDSALAQTYGPLEVIVVDDGSTDDTPQQCATYGDRIHYIRRANGGTAAARNTALAAARGEFVALLDHDDCWLPTKIEKQVLCMGTDPRIGMVHTAGRVVDRDTGRTTSVFAAAPDQDYHDLLTWCKVSCASVMMRQSALETVGLFDESLPGVDDWDMWIRLAWAHRVVGLAEELTEIREHGKNQGGSYARMFPLVRQAIIKRRPEHANCDACLAARRAALRQLRRDYFAKALNRAGRIRSQGGLWPALVVVVDGVRKYPEAIARLPRRALMELLG